MLLWVIAFFESVVFPGPAWEVEISSKYDHFWAILYVI